MNDEEHIREHPIWFPPLPFLQQKKKKKKSEEEEEEGRGGGGGVGGGKTHLKYGHVSTSLKVSIWLRVK